MLNPYSKEEKEFVNYLLKKNSRKNLIRKGAIFAFLISILIVAGVILVALPSNEPCIPSSELDGFGWSEQSAINYARDIIASKLTMPSTAEFSNEKAKITNYEENYNEYRITGNLKTLNSYGIAFEKKFFVNMKCLPNNQYELNDYSIY